MGSDMWDRGCEIGDVGSGMWDRGCATYVNT